MSGLRVTETKYLELKKPFRSYLISARLEITTVDQTIMRISKIVREKQGVSADIAVEWINERFEQGAEKTTLNQYIKSLRHWCRFRNESWAKEIRFYDEDEKIPEIFSNQEIEAILELPPLPIQNKTIYKTWTFFWLLCAHTGARMSEIRTLTVGQADFGRHCIVLQKTKTGRARTIPLIPHVEFLLHEYIQTLETQHLFPARRGQNQVRMGRVIDRPCTSRAYLKEFRQRCERLGIQRPVKPKNFRHTAITRWLTESKLNLFEVKRLAGQRKTSTTEKYYQYARSNQLIEMMKTDSLVRHLLPQDEQFTQLVQDYKGVFVNDKLFVREIHETKDKFLISVEKKCHNL